MENDMFRMDAVALEPLLNGNKFLVVIPRRKLSTFHDEDLQNLLYLMLGVVVGLISWHWIAAFGIGLVIFAFVRGIFDERAVLPLSDQSRFMKIRAGRAYSRFYYLDKDLSCLRYRGSRKLQCLQGQIEAINVREISDVQDICDNEVARAARSHGFSEENCLSLVFDSVNGTCLDLVAESRDVRDAWATGLRLLLANERKKSHWSETENIFRELDTNGDGLLTFDESMELLQRYKVGVSKVYGREVFNNESVEKTPMKDGTYCLSMKQLTALLGNVGRRPELFEIFDKLSERKHIITPVKMKQFLELDQHDNVSVETCANYIEEFDVCPLNNMCMSGFNKFLLSQRSMIFNIRHREIYQDMTRPLNHYFIATSHNTYLLKDQIKGPSSVDGYVRALKRGCRCVELDCWDGPNNEPIIYHGHTWTSKILFKDVVEGINKYAFTASSYPVILSFENHCSVDQQRVMATHLKNIFGDKLYAGAVTKDMTALPSPEALKGKILIKGKKLASATDDEMSEDEEDDYAEVKAALGDMSPTDMNGMKDEDNHRTLANLNTHSKVKGSLGDVSPTEMNGIKDEAKNRTLANFNTSSKESDDLTDGEVGVDENSGGDENENIINSTPQKKTSTLKKVKLVLTTNRSNSKESRDSLGGDTKSEKTKKKKIKVAKELSDLVIWCQSVSFQNFKHSKDKHKYFEMCSFEEKKAMKLLKNEGVSFAQFNQRQLSRIYPAGHRVDSSNYSPESLWNVGCQMVALNYQTAGKAMELNQGKFNDNGRCGYVLKPDYLRIENCPFDPRLSGEEYQPASECTTLKIKIISGYQLPKLENSKSERDLFVAVKVFGVDADSHKTRTWTVKNSGYNPIWNETMEIKIWRQELALIKFSAKEGENSRSTSKPGTQIGHFILPFHSIQQGYRHIQLLSKSGELLENALLFVHIDISKGTGKT